MISAENLLLVVAVFALVTLLAAVVAIYLDDFLDWLRRRRGRR